MSRQTLTFPVNRVEGDLEVRVEISNHKVISAQIVGTMFRGFEQMMSGRDLLDGLVITPRICGICSTSHLYAAALALDDLFQAEVPDNAIRMRNLTHIAEHLQSDLRHTILMFAVDFAHQCYAGHSFHADANRCYLPLQGDSAISTVKATRQLLEIVAIIGGQWPHSSFMVPGGIVSTPSSADLRKCRMILEEFSRWYEIQILGGPLREFQTLKNAQDLDAWCQDAAHKNGDLPRITAIAKALQLDQGDSEHSFISAGSLPLPKSEQNTRGTHLLASGYWDRNLHEELHADLIGEELTHSYYREQPTFAASLFTEQTQPDADKTAAYSWVKAPRYRHKPVETSPLAELICGGHSLMTDWVATRGVSPLARELARLIRPTLLLPAAFNWIAETDPLRGYYIEPAPIKNGQGLGLVQASRGMLGHWLEAHEGKIANYQIISPTSWNASPRDKRGQAGPMEQALLGARVADPDNPIELGHIVRSFDPCLVCAVHSLHNNKRSILRIGGR